MIRIPATIVIFNKIDQFHRFDFLETMLARLFLVTACVTIASGRIIVIKKGNDALWQEYKDQYQKDYSDVEEASKKSAWEKRLQEIFHHNLEYSKGKHSYNVGVNHFSDMTDDEVQVKWKGLEEALKCNNKNMLYTPPKHAHIPDSIDWNERGYVTRVVNQGECGACWAFCAIAALEGQHKRITGHLLKLSEQQLVDCSTLTGNKQCDGGQMCRAYEYAAKEGAVDTETYYPYVDKGGVCKYSAEHAASKVKGYLDIAYGDEDALLMAVALIGPVAAGLDGYRSTFLHYKSGIYDDPGCSNTTLNHALTIVGYGTENGKDYWLVKNSWSAQWGDNGFAKMVRNKNNQCGLASAALFPVLHETQDGTPLLDGKRAS